jgi:hypothetical protein
MPDRTPVAMTSHERFQQIATEEMAKFESQERELRRSERLARAAELHIPIEIGSDGRIH